MPRPLLPLLLLLAACEAEDVRSLTLDPIAARGHGPWTGTPVFWIERDGVVRQEPAVAAGDGTWRLEDAEDVDGATVGLLFPDPGADLDALDLREVRAWGRTPPVALGDDLDTVIPVLVSEPGRVGVFGEVTREQAAIAPAAAMLPDGDVLIFGGARVEPETTPRDETETQVLRLSRLDRSLAFERVDTIPTTGHERAPRIAATATVVHVEGRPRILLAGGRHTWGPNAASNTPVGFLYDPDAAPEQAWTPVRTALPRSQHAAVALADGRVVLLGGYEEGPLPGLFTWEVVDLATHTAEAQAQVSVGAVGFGHAHLGEEGIVVCGGLFSQVPDLLGPTSGCARLDAAVGTAAPLPDLPEPRAFHAAAPLPDGGVLVVGGLTDALDGIGPVAASADVLRLDPSHGGWTVVGTLAHPRALHALVPLPDGRVVVLGGVPSLRWFPDSEFAEAVTCAEVYDPATDALTTLEPCELAGAGALPAVASAPGAGVFVLAGPGNVQDAFPARAWGLIATGPAPSP